MGAAMIEALAGFEPRTAAGILARLALALDGDADNPDAKPRVPDEEAIRQRILAELRDRIALSDQDDQGSVERLYEAIDEESDSLLGLPDLDPALERLSERGELPSDSYIVEFTDSLRTSLEQHGLPLEAEQELIRLTVREPHAEQHYGPRISDDQPSLISIFARRFTHQYPARDFILLALGRRHGLKLEVQQAWRIYPAVVRLGGVTTLVDIVRRFAEHFGYPVTVGGHTDQFILFAHVPYVPHHVADIVGVAAPASAREFYISGMFRVDATEGIVEVAFAMAIDLVRYRQVLSRLAR
jgi:hypothetical protein